MPVTYPRGPARGRGIAVAAALLAGAAGARGQWSAPVNLGAPLNSPDAEAMCSLTADGRTMVLALAATGSTTYRLYQAAWAGGWQAPVLMPGVINQGSTVWSPAISADGTVLVFSSDQVGSFGGTDLFLSTNPGTGWTSPINLGLGVNSLLDDFGPTLDAAGTTLVYASFRGGGSGHFDLWTSTYAGGWSTPANLGSPPNSSQWDAGPDLTADGQTLYFSSFAPGGVGGSDIWVTTKVAGAWQAPANLGGLVNHGGLDGWVHVGCGGGCLFFVSDRPGGQGDRDIWATGQPLLVTTTSLPYGRAGVPYAAPIEAYGGIQPWQWSLVGGTLPPGFTLDAATGALAGTPLATGTWAFQVQVTDTQGASDDQALTLVVYPAAGTPVNLAIGAGAAPAAPPQVDVYRVDGVQTPVSFAAYGSTGFGANVGGAEVDGDSLREILAGPGPGAVYGPQVRGFTEAGVPLAKINFFAYGTLRFGAGVAGGGIDGDAFDEILTGAGPGAVFGPHVRGFDYDNAAVAALPKVSFFAYGTLKYGVNAASGDVDADGFGELLTGPGPGQVFGAQLRGFDYDGTALAGIGKINAFVLGAGARHGLTTAAGNVDGDAFDEIACGSGPDPAASSALQLLGYDGTALASLWLGSAYGAGAGGVRATLGEMDGDAADELATAPGGPVGSAQVVGFDWNGTALAPLPGLAFDAFPAYGAKIGSGFLGF